jgi:enamine deaminase RidA (YjgF/YER057c/UK114 family)
MGTEIRDSGSRPDAVDHRDGGRFEAAGGYVRAKRVGDLVFVAGTTAIEPSGRVHAPDDVYAQSRFTLERIGGALEAVGSGLDEVVRVRAYLTQLDRVGEFARAHRELLGDARPVLTAVGAALATPGLVVEIEADAVSRPDRV